MIPFHPKNMFLKKNEDITINIQQIVCFLKFDLSRSSAPETHDFWELNYVYKGNGAVSSNGEIIPLNEGEVFFQKPGAVHYSIAKKDSPITLFCISFCATNKIINVFEGLKFALNREQKELILKMYEEAKNLFVNGNKNADSFSSKKYKDDPILGSYQMLKMYLEIFLISIAREVVKSREVISYDTKESLEKLIYNKIIEKISDSLYSGINVDDICENFNYSRSHIYNIFKKHSGTSIMNYYNALKIGEAKRLIQEGNHSLSEISEILKFNNSYYFSKTFKKYTNSSPSEYKKRFHK